MWLLALTIGHMGTSNFSDYIGIWKNAPVSLTFDSVGEEIVSILERRTMRLHSLLSHAAYRKRRAFVEAFMWGSY